MRDDQGNELAECALCHILLHEMAHVMNEGSTGHNGKVACRSDLPHPTKPSTTGERTANESSPGDQGVGVPGAVFTANGWQTLCPSHPNQGVHALLPRNYNVHCLQKHTITKDEGR